MINGWLLIAAALLEKLLFNIPRPIIKYDFAALAIIKKSKNVLNVAELSALSASI